MELTAGRLRIAGALDTYNATELRDRLSEALREQAALTLDLAGVESCDFSTIQLLCAARRTAEAAGKPLVVEGVSEGILSACATLGISPEIFSAAGSA